MKILDYWDWKHSTDVNFRNRHECHRPTVFIGGMITGGILIYLTFALIVIHYFK